jgi:hypothetical protein
MVLCIERRWRGHMAVVGPVAPGRVDGAAISCAIVRRGVQRLLSAKAVADADMKSLLRLTRTFALRHLDPPRWLRPQTHAINALNSRIIVLRSKWKLK